MIRLGLILLTLVASLLAASTWRVFGHTWDEPEHLAAGMQLLDRGKYEYDTEHPPLARALIALGPRLAGSHSFGTPPPNGTQEGIDILYDGGHYDRTLVLARLGALPFLPLLLFAMWLWARRVARSDGEALLGVLALACVPAILGHAALAALDVPGTATTLLALYLLQRWLTSGLRRDAILFGIATGVAFCTKLSAIPFIGLGMLVLLLLRVFLSVAPAAVSVQRRWMGLFLMALATLIPITLVYGLSGLSITPLPPRCNWALAYLFPDGSNGWVKQLQLPAAWWNFAEGVMALEAHNDTGHVSFLLGNIKSGGWWYFYLVALAGKTPLPLLLSGIVGLYLLARDGLRQASTWRMAPVVLFVTLLVFSSAFSRINIGIRHVLILYPFLALASAYALATTWRAAPRIGSALAGLFIVWQVSPVATAWPDYFPYFNELVSNPQHVLVDSDLDWGQDLRRLERRLVELKVPSVSLAYQGTADLAREPLPPFVRLPPRQPATGWVAITALTREHETLGYTWLSAYRPVERVGKTVDLYFIPP
ncbi:MAG: glycosyltransferase family 39 protein [Proteobacteria bacterium]|nr:glycosyltransferase family 39 protein [Pseudomonadota bacterium]